MSTLERLNGKKTSRRSASGRKQIRFDAAWKGRGVLFDLFCEYENKKARPTCHLIAKLCPFAAAGSRLLGVSLWL